MNKENVKNREIRMGKINQTVSRSREAVGRWPLVAGWGQKEGISRNSLVKKNCQQFYRTKFKLFRGAFSRRNRPLCDQNDDK